MKYYISVDGGGTKTDYLLTNINGEFIEKVSVEGCTYSTMGSQKVYEILKRGLESLLDKKNISSNDIEYIVWGISCFGEYEDFDNYISYKLKNLISCDCYICNDVEIGMAGSLLMKSGVHVVAGTGAIAMGKDSIGRTARANGWHESFSDEGSAYWLGKKTLALFAKQADGRENKNHLYSIVYEKLGLKCDKDIIIYYKNNLSRYRDKVAALQMILLEAAKRGDESAITLYERAAKELYQTVNGICEQLEMPKKGLKVSYYGGVFKSGNYILGPFSKYLVKQGSVLCEPELSPLSGGILLAVSKHNRQNLDSVIVNLKTLERCMK